MRRALEWLCVCVENVWKGGVNELECVKKYNENFVYKFALLFKGFNYVYKRTINESSPYLAIIKVQ